MSFNQVEPAGGLPAVSPPAAMDAATINAVAGLLAQVGNLTRAQRPIVIHESAPAVAAAPAGPGAIDVKVPGPPPRPAELAPPREPGRRLFTRPEVCLYAGMAGMLSGGLSVGVGGNVTAGVAAALSALFTLGSGVAIVRDEGKVNRGRAAR